MNWKVGNFRETLQRPKLIHNTALIIEQLNAQIQILNIGTHDLNLSLESLAQDASSDRINPAP